MLLFLLIIPQLLIGNVDSILQKAHRVYRQGEAATTLEERSDAFNKALMLYSEVANIHQHAALHFNIGNCYFQLAEYPLAIYHYEQAKSLRPRDRKIQDHLLLSRGRLGIVAKQVTPLTYLLYPHNQLSVGERVKLTLVLTLAWFCFASLSIYLPWFALRRLQQALGISVLCLLFSLSWTYYLSPVQAILLTPSSLHRDAGSHYSRVLEKPALAGQKVIVLDMKEGGEWLKIQLRSGQFGFVPSTSLRILNSR